MPRHFGTDPPKRDLRLHVKLSAQRVEGVKVRCSSRVDFSPDQRPRHCSNATMAYSYVPGGHEAKTLKKTSRTSKTTGKPARKPEKNQSNQPFTRIPSLSDPCNLPGGRFVDPRTDATDARKRRRGRTELTVRPSAASVPSVRGVCCVRPPRLFRPSAASVPSVRRICSVRPPRLFRPSAASVPSVRGVRP